MALSTQLAEATRQLIAAAKARRLCLARTAARAPAARAAGALVGAPGRQRVADRADRNARGTRALLLPVRGPARAPGPGHPVLLPPVARDAAHVQPHRQRLRLRAAVADPAHAHAGRTRPPARGTRRRGGHAGGAQRRRTRPPAVPRNRAHRRPRLPGLSRRAQSGAAPAGVLGAALRGLRGVRPGKPAAGAGGARSAGAPARSTAHRRRARAPAPQPRPADASGAADAVRVSAAGRDVSRGTLDRGARCARRADGRGAGARGNAGRTRDHASGPLLPARMVTHPTSIATGAPPCPPIRSTSPAR